MNTHPDNRTAYEAQMAHLTAEHEFRRADFMSRPSVMLGLLPKLDGDSWCVLMGENLQVGIAGFGDSPEKAMAAFDKAWYEKAVKL